MPTIRVASLSASPGPPDHARPLKVAIAEGGRAPAFPFVARIGGVTRIRPLPCCSPLRAAATDPRAVWCAPGLVEAVSWILVPLVERRVAWDGVAIRRSSGARCWISLRRAERSPLPQALPRSRRHRRHRHPHLGHPPRQQRPGLDRDHHRLAPQRRQRPAHLRLQRHRTSRNQPAQRPQNLGNEEIPPDQSIGRDLVNRS